MQFANGVIGNILAWTASGGEPDGTPSGRNRSKSRAPRRSWAALTQPPTSGFNLRLSRPAVRRNPISVQNRFGIAGQLAEGVAIERDPKAGSVGNFDHAVSIEAPTADGQVVHIR
jgi:hypothetical protein